LGRRCLPPREFTACEAAVRQTGGVSGRHEIDGTQELNYHSVAQTIAELGFTGYIAHEYKPSPGHDGIQTLNQALEIMDV
jgi:hydroxypyruvate isomerase